MTAAALAWEAEEEVSEAASMPFSRSPRSCVVRNIEGGFRRAWGWDVRVTHHDWGKRKERGVTWGGVGVEIGGCIHGHKAHESRQTSDVGYRRCRDRATGIQRASLVRGQECVN